MLIVDTQSLKQMKSSDLPLRIQTLRGMLVDDLIMVCTTTSTSISTFISTAVSNSQSVLNYNKIWLT